MPLPRPQRRRSGRLESREPVDRSPTMRALSLDQGMTNHLITWREAPNAYGKLGRSVNDPAGIRGVHAGRCRPDGNINAVTGDDLDPALAFHGDRETSADLVDLAVNVRSAPPPTWLAAPI